jgi:putative MATE family efflux protein
MRAVGDTLRPLIFLIVGGVLNIGLNIFFIVVLGKDVEGVAIATVASQAVAAILSLIVLARSNGYAKLERKYFRIFKNELIEIIKYGLPIGFQRCMFSISNVVVASTINSYGEQVMAANTIAHQFDAIVHDATDAFSMAVMAFIAQNLGAKNFKRIWQIIWRSLIMVSIVGGVLGTLSAIFSPQLCDIMTDDPEIIAYGVTRISIMGALNFITGMMNVFANTLRGMGKNLSAMISSLLCTCVFRIIWLNSIYLLVPSPMMLYVVYPISWALCAICYAAIAIPSLKKMQLKHEMSIAENKQEENLTLNNNKAC